MAKVKKPIRDTMSRCDPPSMLWDTVRNPYATHRPEPSKLVQTENQAVQKRINKQVYNRLSHVQNPFFQLLSFIFGQICFVVGLPPHFFLCLVPRWGFSYLVLPTYKFISGILADGAPG